MEETSSSAEGTTAGDPRILAKQFWESLATGHPEIAEDIARRIRAPTISNFTFEESQEATGAEVDTDYVDAGEYLSKVSPKTPKAVVNYWNSDKEVTLIRVEWKSWCLARSEKEGDDRDFRVCAKPKQGVKGCETTFYLDAPRGLGADAFSSCVGHQS